MYCEAHGMLPSGVRHFQQRDDRFFISYSHAFSDNIAYQALCVISLGISRDIVNLNLCSDSASNRSMGNSRRQNADHINYLENT